MPYSAYCLFVVPPNKRLDPVLCSIGKWLIESSYDTNCAGSFNICMVITFEEPRLSLHFSRLGNHATFSLVLARSVTARSCFPVLLFFSNFPRPLGKSSPSFPLQFCLSPVRPRFVQHFLTLKFENKVTRTIQSGLSK